MGVTVYISLLHTQHWKMTPSYHLCVLLFELILMFFFFFLSETSLYKPQGNKIATNLLISNSPSFCSVQPIHAGVIWAQNWLTHFISNETTLCPFSFFSSCLFFLFTSQCPEYNNKYTVGIQHSWSSETTKMLLRKEVNLYSKHSVFSLQSFSNQLMNCLAK